MYAYGRFWDSERLILLYPGNHYDSKYQKYPNEYDKNRNHQCKIAMVSVLEDMSLDFTIGERIINMLNAK